MTFARDPFGPFFCGIAWYVHANCADEQFRHGFNPSHLTFRLWHASQARFTDVEVDVGADDDFCGAKGDMATGGDDKLSFQRPSRSTTDASDGKATFLRCL